jgi:hypothetical protein
LKAREFLFMCEDLAMKGLPPGLPVPERKVMWTILQLHFGNPQVHFELQPQVGRSQVELGLHFEGPVEVNDALAARVASQAADLIPALGDRWELEVWTASWRRLHRTFPAEKLTYALANEVAAELARAVTLLAPLIVDVEPAQRAAGPKVAAPSSRRHRRPARR